MYTRKELVRIFGNITYCLSVGLKSDANIVSLSEEIPCQLFYFPKKANNLLFCLYLDGVDYESIILSVLSVNPDNLKYYTAKHILGDDFNYRIPNVYVVRFPLDVSSYDILNWKDDDVVKYINSQRWSYQSLRKLLKRHKWFQQFNESFIFVPNSIDIRLTNKK